MNLFDLEAAHRILTTSDPRVPPAGPMAPYVGPQLTVDQIIERRESSDHGLYGPVPPEVFAQVRAFHVPALEGITFVCEPDAFGDAIIEVLTARLPGAEGRFFSAGLIQDGLIEKYWILDAGFPAPLDEATGQFMWFDFVGSARNPGTEWEYGAHWGQVIEVGIDTAIWTNVGRLGIDAGLYL